MKKFLRILVCLLLIIPNFFPLIAGIGENVYAENEELGSVIKATSIADYNLRTQLNIWCNTYHYPEFYENMFVVENITELDFSGKKISSLEGLGLFNLETITKIDFSDNQIANYDSEDNYVNAIPELTFEGARNLETLDLSGNLLQRVNFSTYAKKINLSNNRLLYVTIWDNRLETLNLSNNYISDSNRISIDGRNANDFEIIAYNNFMAGKSLLSNAYLGIQNLTLYVSQYSDADYELFSNSDAYLVYVYPFKKVVTGKDNDGNLIYEDIVCTMSLLDYETKEYHKEVDFEFVDNGNGVEKDKYKTFKPKSGYYKIEFLTKSGKHIYSLDENYEPKTKTEKGEIVNVVNEEYKDIILRAKPSESGNVSLLYKGDLYDHELSVKGPVTLKLYCTIPGVTFKYLLNGYGKERVDNYIIPYEGDEIYLDKTSYYTLTVWIIENGAISDRINFALNINVPRKVTIANWIFIILGIVVIAGGLIYFLYRASKNNYAKEINDFEW